MKQSPDELGKHESEQNTGSRVECTTDFMDQKILQWLRSMLFTCNIWEGKKILNKETEWEHGDKSYAKHYSQLRLSDSVTWILEKNIKSTCLRPSLRTYETHTCSFRQFLRFHKLFLQGKTSQTKFLNFLKTAIISQNSKVKNYILLELYKYMCVWNLIYCPHWKKKLGQKFLTFPNESYVRSRKWHSFFQRSLQKLKNKSG